MVCRIVILTILLGILTLAFGQEANDPQLIMLLTDVDPNAAIFTVIVPGLKITKLFISHLSSPMAIDYDKKGKHIYWVDSGAKEVRRSDIDGGNPQALALLNSSSVPEGLTLDSNTRQVFYTDDGNDVIVRVEMDTFRSTEIVSGLLERPRGIVADTKTRNLYWVDFGRNQKVETCDYNGGSRRTVVSERLLYPYGITIDEQAGRLFWADAAGYIETSLISGTGRKVIRESLGRKFYDISFFNGFLYYTIKDDILQKDIYVMTEDGKQRSYIYNTGVRRPLGIHIFSPDWNKTGSCPYGQYGLECKPCGKCIKRIFCEKTTGLCHGGCDPGYKRFLCLQAEAVGSGIGLSNGAIAGIVVGVIVVIMIIIIAVVIYKREKKSPNSAPNHAGTSRSVGNDKNSSQAKVADTVGTFELYGLTKCEIANK